MGKKVRKTKAEEIVTAILDELNGRKGCGIDDLDDDIQEEIREALTEIVEEILDT